jgi:hypothetical protein
LRAQLQKARDRAEPKDVAVPVNIVVRESSRFLTRRE